MKNFTVDSKVDLLEHLIETSQTWDDPDLAAFFAHAQSTFKGFKGTTWEGADLEDKLRGEEKHWLSECDGSRSRRRGHEKGSYYDNAMGKWKKIWNELLIKDWQNELDNGRAFEEVPLSLREHLVRPKNVFAMAPHSPAPATTPKPRVPLVKADPIQSSPTKPLEHQIPGESVAAKAKKLEFEYDGAKLKRVVDSAVEKAREIGKVDLADAVQMIYHDSQENFELRYLLDHILKQTADEEQNTRFQDYVRAAKRKIKMQRGQKHRSEMIKDGDRRAKKLLHRAKVAKESGKSSPPVVPTGEKLCDEKTWSSKCPCAQCLRDKAEYTEDATGVTDAEHQRKYEEFMRKNGLDAGKTKDSSRAPPPMYQHAVEIVSPVKKDSATWQVSKTSNEDERVRTVDTDITQLGAEQHASKQGPQDTVQANGKLASAKTGGLSHSSYRTLPHHDPLVTEILGDLQYEPSVKKLLRQNRALPTNANIKDLRRRESALEAIKTIVTETPAAKTDLKVMAEKLEERDAREAEADGEVRSENQASAGAEDDSQYNNEQSGEESENEYKEDMDEDITPRSKRALRPRLSTAEIEETERDYSGRRRSHKWPCPLAKEAGCDQWFSSSGHAVRHGKIHTGIKDFTCPACDKAFARKDNMMEHFRGVHKNRVPSTKRGRRSSTQSSNAISEEADQRAEERAAKRRQSMRKNAAKDTTDSRASRDSSIVSGRSTDSSLTETFSTDEERHEPGNPESFGRHGSVPREHEVVLHGSMIAQLSTTSEPAVLLARLEAKIDALIGRDANTMINGTSRQPHAEHAMVSSAESLLDIATSLQTGALHDQSPEFIQFVARLTRTAAEAVIDASNSAKASAAMAREISMMLEEQHGPAAQISV